MATIVGRNMWEATLFVIQQVYMSVYGLMGFVPRKKSAFYGHESLKIGLFFLHSSPVE